MRDRYKLKTRGKHIMDLTGCQVSASISAHDLFLFRLEIKLLYLASMIIQNYENFILVNCIVIYELFTLIVTKKEVVLIHTQQHLLVRALFSFIMSSSYGLNCCRHKFGRVKLHKNLSCYIIQGVMSIDC